MSQNSERGFGGGDVQGNTGPAPGFSGHPGSEASHSHDDARRVPTGDGDTPYRAATAGAADPFSPPGVAFTPVSPSLITVRYIVGVPFFAIGLIATLVLAIVVTPWVWIAVAVAAVFTIWFLWLVPRQVKAIGFAEAEDDLLIRRGVLFKKLTVVPYGRMQFVDVNQGPVDRKFKISKVTLNTASATTDAVLPGLPEDVAHHLRDRLTERGEARLAGL